MNREQILAMGPEELAQATAVHVMGWTKESPSNYTYSFWADEKGQWRFDVDGDSGDNWNPAEDISAAWKILNKMRDEHPVKFEVALYEIMNPKRVAHQISPIKIIWYMSPFRICQAALLATLDPRGGDAE